jgi:hypothetical protein
MVRKRKPEPAIVPKEAIVPKKNVPVETTWNVSETGKESFKLFLNQMGTKHGMYASIPMTCKGSNCPYTKVCLAMEYGMAPIGERCTREMAMIFDKVDKYCKELEVDDTKIVNLSLIIELIDAEIMIMRCDSLLAAEGEIIQDVAVGVTDSGKEITRPEIHKAVDMKEKWIKIRHNVLNQLNSTPKDKARQEVGVTIDPSKYASRLLKLAEEEDKNLIIDVSPQETES